MNGNVQIILNKITEIETKQEERHRENKDALQILYAKHVAIDKLLSRLNCRVHAERMVWLGRYIKGTALAISMVIGWLMRTHITK